MWRAFVHVPDNISDIQPHISPSCIPADSEPVSKPNTHTQTTHTFTSCANPQPYPVTNKPTHT